MSTGSIAFVQPYLFILSYLYSGSFDYMLREFHLNVFNVAEIVMLKNECLYVLYVCMYVCMYVWMDGWMDGCMYECMYVCMYVHTVCMHVCMYCIHVCVYMYVCVCMYDCMHVCMCMYVLYVCMYIQYACICMYVHYVGMHVCSHTCNYLPLTYCTLTRPFICINLSVEVC